MGSQVIRGSLSSSLPGCGVQRAVFLVIVVSLFVVALCSKIPKITVATVVMVIGGEDSKPPGFV